MQCVFSPLEGDMHTHQWSDHHASKNKNDHIQGIQEGNITSETLKTHQMIEMNKMIK